MNDEDQIIREWQEPRESYGAWIEYSILTHPKLNDRQKILYARIQNLATKRGYCYASNQWFSEQMTTSIPTIKRDLKILRDLKMINYTMKVTKSGSIRCIYLGGSDQEIGGGQITGDPGGQITGDPQNNNRENIYIPPEIKNDSGDTHKNENDPDPIKLVIANNPRFFRDCPITIDNKKVTVKELEQILLVMKEYNDVREIYRCKPGEKYRAVNPDNKTCRQIVRMARDGIELKTFSNCLYNMFEAENHKKNNWMYLTPEFVTRDDKMIMYSYDTKGKN